jgi:hypothetical protein
VLFYDLSTEFYFFPEPSILGEETYLMYPLLFRTTSRRTKEEQKFSLYTQHKKITIIHGE